MTITVKLSNYIVYLFNLLLLFNTFEVVQESQTNDCSFITNGSACITKTINNYNKIIYGKIKKPEEELLEKGNNCLISSDYICAFNSYDKAVNINNKFYQAYFMRAFTRIILEDEQRALKDINQTLKINSKFAEAYDLLACIHYKLGDKQTAINDLNQALKINNKIAGFYKDRGYIRHKLGDEQEALNDYDQSLTIYPYDADVLLFRGDILHKLGDIERALDDYKKASILYGKENNPMLFMCAYAKATGYNKPCFTSDL